MDGKELSYQEKKVNEESELIMEVDMPKMEVRWTYEEVTSIIKLTPSFINKKLFVSITLGFPGQCIEIM